MAIYQGARSVKYITMKDSDGAFIDISGWELRATLRRAINSPDELGELTMANGGFVLVDSANGRLAIVLDDTLTAVLPVGRVYFDVLHDNAPDGPVWIFGGSFIVKQPVTR
jgi:hypothetical protein